ncbi:uncharacterized protein BDR25DRAFT_354668 [Lindgomyces ingoldianus]|uniref:Uncharacterized protein n=1 Tax=Lindgomyces ingoldianus TaxID=673940 RepID=A0ACB6QXY4_9PLEO|nr:uncharacterized protein BDR25DRAFT_354668 [Lindgomyces ingoldianus]KAF2471428.1 hypothetical protein BDR25DRAFT_354668 [Lindgomyces ingoldianus]
MSLTLSKTRLRNLKYYRQMELWAFNGHLYRSNSSEIASLKPTGYCTPAGFPLKIAMGDDNNFQCQISRCEALPLSIYPTGSWNSQDVDHDHNTIRPVPGETYISHLSSVTIDALRNRAFHVGIEKGQGTIAAVGGLYSCAPKLRCRFSKWEGLTGCFASTAAIHSLGSHLFRLGSPIRSVPSSHYQSQLNASPSSTSMGMFQSFVFPQVI